MKYKIYVGVVAMLICGCTSGPSVETAAISSDYGKTWRVIGLNEARRLKDLFDNSQRADMQVQRYWSPKTRIKLSTRNESQMIIIGDDRDQWSDGKSLKNIDVVAEGVIVDVLGPQE